MAVTIQFTVKKRIWFWPLFPVIVALVLVRAVTPQTASAFLVKRCLSIRAT